MSMNTQSGTGRPTKYTNQILENVIEYTNNCVKLGTFLTVEGLASTLGVGTRTLYDWEKIHPDFSHALDILRDSQRQLLITNGLTGDYSSRFAIFLLKASHGMTEKEPLVNATQTNNLNISPELLADALKIMEDKKS